MPDRNKPEITSRTQAAALGWRANLEPAPRLLAFGKGPTAEKILEIAGREGIPVISDPQLNLFLSQMRVGSEIPENLYRTVSIILGSIYQENHKLADITEKK